MFIRFRQVKAERYGDGERICAGKCKDRPRYYARHGAGMVVKGRTFVEGCPMKPLCPLAHPRVRLEVSILETRREGGKVKQQHVASLGSISADYTIACRVYFWAICDERLARLANRIGPDMDRLRQAIAARIPLPTDDDRAKLDAYHWDQLEDQYLWLVERDKKQIARAEEKIRKRQERLAEFGEPIVAEIKRLRATGNKYDEAEEAQKLAWAFGGLITDSI
jgi:hypothetical protein